MKTSERSRIGKKSRTQGGAFELRVRADLEEKGWIVDKWTNNVDLDTPDKAEECRIKKLIPAKPKYLFINGSMKMVGNSSGFPDFIAFRNQVALDLYEVIGVECKMTGNLDKLEKEKCFWYLENGIFSNILIAEKTKVKNRIQIIYHDFEEKYGKIQTQEKSK